MSSCRTMPTKNKIFNGKAYTRMISKFDSPVAAQKYKKIFMDRYDTVKRVRVFPFKGKYFLYKLLK